MSHIYSGAIHEAVSHEEIELSDDPWWKQWDPYNVTVKPDDDDDDYDGPDNAWKTCVLQGVYFGENEYNGWLGARISSIFVIMAVSTCFTLFPVLAKRFPRLRIHKYVYAVARYFGTGVIVATAFIHLMDPAYGSIGGTSCVGSTGNWSLYAWCPAIMLTSAVITFLVDLFCSMHVEQKYGISLEHGGDEVEDAIIRKQYNGDIERPVTVEDVSDSTSQNGGKQFDRDAKSVHVDTDSDISSIHARVSFQSEFAAFLILEFGILFHSVMIGLTLGSTGDEFATLYPVLVFHQSFEGLGIGARLSAIEFPKGKKWWPYPLCIAYGLTTPIAVAIGLGVRTTYKDNSYTVQVVSGVLDSISAGILLYTGFVELLAKDFVFNPKRTKSMKEMFFIYIHALLWGAGLMALLGKWA